MKKLFVALLFLAGCKAGADKTKLTDLEVEKLKRIQAELALVKQQEQPLNTEQQAIAEIVCKRAGFTLDTCSINLNTGIVTESKKQGK